MLSNSKANLQELFGLALNITISILLIVGISFPGILWLPSLIASRGLVTPDTSESRGSITNLHGVQSSSCNLYLAPPSAPFT